MRGDANLDGTVDVSDAVLLAKFVSGDASAKIRDQGKLNADVNQNGAPDDDDITQILKIIVKLI